MMNHNLVNSRRLEFRTPAESYLPDIEGYAPGDDNTTPKGSIEPTLTSV